MVEIFVVVLIITRIHLSRYSEEFASEFLESFEMFLLSC